MSNSGKIQELCVAAWNKLTNDKHLYEKWDIIFTGKKKHGSSEVI